MMRTKTTKARSARIHQDEKNVNNTSPVNWSNESPRRRKTNSLLVVVVGSFIAVCVSVRVECSGGVLRSLACGGPQRQARSYSLVTGISAAAASPLVAGGGVAWCANAAAAEGASISRSSGFVW